MTPIDSKSASDSDRGATAHVASSLAQVERLPVRLSPDDRVMRGRSARHELPRSCHGKWEPEATRLDPIALLEEQARTRVPELVPIRHGRMLVSPFTFYRGGALIMAADLAATPRSRLTVQLCGDAHLSNFGVFGSPERQMMFDINDFDETLPGPWEWDVKRLAASFEVAGRELGFAPADRRAIVMAGIWEYRARMRRAAGMSTLDTWYAHMKIRQMLDWIRIEIKEERLGKKDGKDATPDIAKARTRDSTRAFSKLTATINGERRIVGDPPLIVPIEDLVVPGTTREQIEDNMRHLLRSYRRTLTREYHPVEEFRYVHMARKVVGVGSVGTRAWILLLVGRDNRDPLILQAKEAQASVLEPFLGQSRYANHGQRVVVGQRLMQATSDIFLGWQRVVEHTGETRHYYVRQLHDWKGSAKVEIMRVPGATLYARLCGRALARAHARSGDRIAIASYLGKSDVVDRAMADFAVRYADQNERDYESFLKAVRSGRLAAETGL